MLDIILKNIWIIFVILLGLDGQDSYVVHQAEMQEIEDSVKVYKIRIKDLKKKISEIQRYLEDLDETENQLNIIEEQILSCGKTAPREN